ncbi:hypothetical protein GCM10011365_17590 [Marinicella pacifica]|uniref:N-acetyltransferase domain-containing protein n=1 Tax=Marinicella pacifica TaxID=1171543 RepID=A0A917CSX8_9GAMM|nr:GNAT family protein [Marinicella pacifica]GGF96668.1 hypothetical protein GCM10011365_17590 [Marinicella pacifica]
MMQGDYQPTIQFNLTPLKQNHQDLFCALYSDAQVMAFIGAPMSCDAVADYFQRLLGKITQADSGVLYRVIVADTDCGKSQYAGIVRLTKHQDNRETIIGVMLLPQFQGLGLAYLAQKQLMTEIQSNASNQLLTAYCHINNERAHRLYQRLGFRQIRELIYHQQPAIQWQREITCKKSKAV